MIGNDIVDISYAGTQSNWKRKGFLHKVFSKEEQAVIALAKNPAVIVWRMWSMKESGYKLHQRKTPIRRFNPSKLLCNISDDIKGTITIENNTYLATTHINDNRIYTYAHTENTTHSINSIIMLDNTDAATQSRICKKLLINKIANYKGYNKSELSINKDDAGVPLVYLNGNETNIHISISHHGRYGAYSISM